MHTGRYPFVFGYTTQIAVNLGYVGGGGGGGGKVLNKFKFEAILRCFYLEQGQLKKNIRGVSILTTPITMAFPHLEPQCFVQLQCH